MPSTTIVTSSEWAYTDLPDLVDDASSTSADDTDDQIIYVDLSLDKVGQYCVIDGEAVVILNIRRPFLGIVKVETIHPVTGEYKTKEVPTLGKLKVPTFLDGTLVSEADLGQCFEEDFEPADISSVSPNRFRVKLGDLRGHEHVFNKKFPCRIIHIQRHSAVGNVCVQAVVFLTGLEVQITGLPDVEVEVSVFPDQLNMDTVQEATTGSIVFNGGAKPLEAENRKSSASTESATEQTQRIAATQKRKRTAPTENVASKSSVISQKSDKIGSSRSALAQKLPKFNTTKLVRTGDLAKGGYLMIDARVCQVVNRAPWGEKPEPIIWMTVFDAVTGKTWTIREFADIEVEVPCIEDVAKPGQAMNDTIDTIGMDWLSLDGTGSWRENTTYSAVLVKDLRIGDFIEYRGAVWCVVVGPCGSFPETHIDMFGREVFEGRRLHCALHMESSVYLISGETQRCLLVSPHLSITPTRRYR